MTSSSVFSVQRLLLVLVAVLSLGYTLAQGRQLRVAPTHAIESQNIAKVSPSQQPLHSLQLIPAVAKTSTIDRSIVNKSVLKRSIRRVPNFALYFDGGETFHCTGSTCAAQSLNCTNGTQEPSSDGCCATCSNAGGSITSCCDNRGGN